MLINNVYIKKLRTPVYSTPFWIIISENITKAIDTVEDLIDHRIVEPASKKSVDAYTYAYEDNEGYYKVLIFLKPTVSIGRLAHEAHHAVNILLSWHGVRPSFTNDEGESYYLEQIVDKIHRVLVQYQKQQKQ